MANTIIEQIKNLSLRIINSIWNSIWIRDIDMYEYYLTDSNGNELKLFLINYNSNVDNVVLEYGYIYEYSRAYFTVHAEKINQTVKRIYLDTFLPIKIINNKNWLISDIFHYLNVKRAFINLKEDYKYYNELRTAIRNFTTCTFHTFFDSYDRFNVYHATRNRINSYIRKIDKDMRRDIIIAIALEKPLPDLFSNNSHRIY